jgi:hypothetical protein
MNPTIILVVEKNETTILYYSTEELVQFPSADTS